LPTLPPAPPVRAKRPWLSRRNVRAIALSYPRRRGAGGRNVVHDVR
jgi:hypothetical protein